MNEQNLLINMQEYDMLTLLKNDGHVYSGYSITI